MSDQSSATVMWFRRDLRLADFDGVDDDPVRCLDRATSEAMVAEKPQKKEPAMPGGGGMGGMGGMDF